MIVKTLYTYSYSLTKLHPGICGENINMIYFYAGTPSKRLEDWPIRNMYNYEGRYWDNWGYDL